LSKNNIRTHNFVFENIERVIASDIDYLLPLKNHKLFYGLIPNPIDYKSIPFNNLKIDKKIIIFLGINRGTYIKKGIPIFEDALRIIKNKYQYKVKIITTENIPYKKYLKLYENTHILLDQVYAYDQGYNALEAMAAGKVVFTGAEKEFLEYYNINEDEVCINATPNSIEIANKLSWLIENPDKIIEIGKNASNFIKEKHDYKKIAQEYIKAYND
jgi:hypothetical protein